MHVPKVKAHGGYGNFAGPQWLASHVNIEIFISKQRAQEIAEAIMEIAHCGGKGDGIIAISPVETIYRIRTKEAYPFDACELK